MKKILYLLLIVIILVVVLYFLIFHPISPIDIEELEEIHMSMNPQSIPKLKRVIKAHQDDYVRERAIFVLTDIALSTNKTSEAIPFLKEISITERENIVRSAAFANLDLLLESTPGKIYGSVDVRIDGDIKKGNIVTLVGIASSTLGVRKASLGISRIVPIPQDTTESGVLGVNLTTLNPVSFPLSAEETREVTFELSLEETGTYGIYVILELNFDRIEYQQVGKEVHLSFDENSGSYIVY